ncbi:MAG: DUF167 domain-containing protein [Candidatus Paceibacterota bacterium]|jgi:uncharacterized protein YggU (UPF0235/DUF167 family)
MHIKVKVFADSKKDEVLDEVGGRLRLFVRAKAEKGLANEGAKKLLAKHFRIKVEAIRIVAGHHSPNKTFFVEKAA